MPYYTKKPFWIIPLIMTGVAFVAAWIVMLLWNAIIPDVMGFKALLYPQALGLLVLCRLLFGNFPQGKNHHWKHHEQDQNARMRDKWKEMSEEERAEFKAVWRQKCEKRKMGN
ncbi:MAG: hypothetical protein J0L94_09515 [Rhodothermia bacterium]|nr:hypothetical protein [Rhodothermia bacterium]